LEGQVLTSSVDKISRLKEIFINSQEAQAEEEEHTEENMETNDDDEALQLITSRIDQLRR
jgi:hypothetical protein